MKIKGKIALWWIVLCALINILFFYSITSVVSTSLFMLIMLVIISLLDVFMVSVSFNNSVTLKDDHFVHVFGFMRNKIMYKNISKISKTSTKLAGSALSFDRLMIFAHTGSIIISLEDNDRFIEELVKKNNNITVG